jgi:hypothetical protein
MLIGVAGMWTMLDYFPESNHSAVESAKPECEIGQECSLSSNTGGDRVFVFASKDALDELRSANTSKEAATRETALMMGGQAYMVPDGTTVRILDWSGLSGWHKVRILDADLHVGDTGYVLDQWTILEPRRWQTDPKPRSKADMKEGQPRPSFFDK